jgi:hypothetical protein
MEDYWLPRREGSRGTEISTLPGGENLGEMADVEYFKEKLFQSLNVPVGRLKSDSGFNLGRASEISRDEVKFGKFIYRLRNRFSQLFDVLLSTQLMLKGVIAKEDWQKIRQQIFYSYLKDTYFSELKNLEIIRERLAVADGCLNYVGKYFSHEYVRRNILMQTDEEMKQNDEQMKLEKNDPRYQAIEAMAGGGMMGMPGGMSGMGAGGPGMGAGGGMDGMDANGMPMGGDMGAQDPNQAGGQQGMPPQDQQQGMSPQDQQQQMPPEQQQQQMPPEQQQQQMPPEEDEDEPIDPDDLPTERVTRNVERLFRR